MTTMELNVDCCLHDTILFFFSSWYQKVVDLGLLDISPIICTERYFNKRIFGAQLEPSKYPLSWEEIKVTTTHIENSICIHILQIVSGTNETIGVTVLKNRGIFTEAKWYWIGLGAMVGYTLLFNLLYTLALSVLSRKYIYKTTYLSRII